MEYNYASFEDYAKSPLKTDDATHLIDQFKKARNCGLKIYQISILGLIFLGYIGGYFKQTVAFLNEQSVMDVLAILAGGILVFSILNIGFIKGLSFLLKYVYGVRLVIEGKDYLLDNAPLALSPTSLDIKVFSAGTTMKALITSIEDQGREPFIFEYHILFHGKNR